MIGTTLGHDRITAKLGEGGPPSLTARFARSYGASAEAKETTR